MFHRRDKAVEQLVCGNALAPEIVHQKDAAVGLEVRRRLVVAQGGTIDQVEKIQGKLAADDNKRATDADPALVDQSRPVVGNFDALVDLLIEDADDVVAHADAMGNPVVPDEGGVNLPANGALAV